MKATAQIFLSYAREDEKKEVLYQQLSAAGFKPWMDTKDILPGEKWERSIQQALQRVHFFLACLSVTSVTKRSYMRREFREALEKRQEMLESDIYLIPVRLEECEVPEELREHQWVDLFKADGWNRLVQALQAGMERRGEGALQKPFPDEPSGLSSGLGQSAIRAEATRPDNSAGVPPASASAAQNPQQIPLRADEAANPAVLRMVLVERFGIEELRTLGFDLHVDAESLPGEGKGALARELVAYLRHRNQLDQLVSYIRQHRPDIKLD